LVHRLKKAASLFVVYLETGTDDPMGLVFVKELPHCPTLLMDDVRLLSVKSMEEIRPTDDTD
jgi:hypothetical protein